ncbi:hypothetical protein AGMMS49975_24660 [Clostridia bacterium]|nr:hypothetical protein AGMMS49975_24660 [Clostridia bacterium]
MLGSIYAYARKQRKGSISGYEAAKSRLKSLNLTDVEYCAAIRKIAGIIKV